MLAETYWELLTDINHWMFELTLILIFDIIISMVAWPFFRKWLAHHDRVKHGANENE